MLNVSCVSCILIKKMSNPLNGHTEYFHFNQLRTRTEQERKILDTFPSLVITAITIMS